MERIEKFISFMGVVRTGHTLIASLLDAHSNISISIEVNPLLKLKDGYSRDELFNKILKFCRGNKKRMRGGYSYSIENSMQRYTKEVYVIGDSMTTFKNMKKFSNKYVLKSFYDFIRVPVYWLWVIRDPFESAHSGHKISGRSIDDILEIYDEIYLLSHKFRKINKNKVFVIYLENFIRNPKLDLSKILDFIGIPYNDEYLDLCYEFVFSEPNKVFNGKVWNRDQVNKINNLIKKIPELGYYPLR